MGKREPDIRKTLLACVPATDILAVLSEEFMPKVVEQLNATDTRRRMALYGGDRIPENQRNLTDVRNRMALLIEYKLAWIGNNILTDMGIRDIFWANIVANRFPDLEIRDKNGRRGIRIEVKCLEDIAEEKSANFDTLKKDLHPSTDFIVVFLWKWCREQTEIVWDRAPKVLDAFLFHASSLAELRDYNWLKSPPRNLKRGYQGYDFRFAVNYRKGKYNKEEGNYGKLLRIWPLKAVYEPNQTPLLRETIKSYRIFEQQVIWSGFKTLASNALKKQSGKEKIVALLNGKKEVGLRNRTLGIILKRLAPTTKEQREICKKSKLKKIVIMSDKYSWSYSKFENSQLVISGKGRKPNLLISHLK